MHSRKYSVHILSSWRSQESGEQSTNGNGAFQFRSLIENLGKGDDDVKELKIAASCDAKHFQMKMRLVTSV